IHQIILYSARTLHSSSYSANIHSHFLAKNGADHEVRFF
ncbi:hypothetical protein YPPY103_2662, partial [Yersinia pestis PY-103]